MRRLLAILVLVAACTSDAATPVTTSPASTTTPTMAVAPARTTTTAPVPITEIVLSPVEAYAAGPDGVEVGYEGGAIVLAGNQVQSITAPLGSSLSVSYPAGPSWSQVLEPGMVIEQAWRRPGPAALEPVGVAWQVNGTLESYLDQLAVAAGLDIASPKWWTLDAAGGLVGEADPTYVAAAAERGVEVWPYATNGFEPTRTRAAIATPAARRDLAQAISEAARSAGAAGVNIDFESFDSTERDQFTAFMAELTESVHGWGGLTSVDITVLTDEFATSHEFDFPIYDRRELAAATDFLVLMAYDQHSTPRPYGPTAALEWVEDGLRHLLRYADPHQVILGVPFYSRLWTPGDPTARAITITRVVELASETGRVPDDEFGLDRATLEDGRFFWVEDYDTLFDRLQLVDELGLAGWAAWRLGFDSPDLWEQVTLPGSGS